MFVLYIMFNYIQCGFDNWKWDGKPRQNVIALPISQDQLREQLRNPIETKPDGYKNTQSSSVRFLQNTNLNTK